jgi:hypothetical protein
MPEFSNDEFRRQLRAADTENRAAITSFREMLKRYFSGGRSPLTAEAKAEILGVPLPGRRNFFTVGAAGLAGAVLLAACGSDDEAAAPAGAEDGDEADMDVVLARGAAATELAAVAAYQAAIDSALVTTAAVSQAAALFQQHHREHADALNAIVTEGDGEAVEDTLPAVQALLDDASFTDELTVVAFARTIEDAAASTYVAGAGLLSTPDLRQALMSIGGVEARHVTALDMAMLALGAGPGATFEDGAFYPTERALPAEQLTALG